MSRRTQGTALWVVAPTVANPAIYELIKIGCPLNFKPGTDSKTKIPDTCLEAEYYTSNMTGLADLGQATFDINADPLNPSHVRLKQWEENDTELKFILGWAGPKKGSVKDIVPELTPATGEVVLPSGRSWNTMTGTIDSFPFDIDGDSLVKSTITIQRKSKVTWVPETT